MVLVVMGKKLLLDAFKGNEKDGFKGLEKMAHDSPFYDDIVL